MISCMHTKLARELRTHEALCSSDKAAEASKTKRETPSLMELTAS